MKKSLEKKPKEKKPKNLSKKKGGQGKKALDAVAQMKKSLFANSKKQGTSKENENKKVQKQNRKPVKIGYKLIAGYCIPVVLIILLGTISYQRSMKSIKGQYEQSVIDTVSAMSLNCKLLCENVQNKGAEFASNDYLQAYYTKSYKADASEAQSVYRSAQDVLTTSRGTSSYIYNFVVFGENGNGISSGTRNTNADTYNEYLETEEGKRFKKASGNTSYWSGYHSYLDGVIQMNPDKYALAYTRTFAKGNGFISLDITTEAIEQILVNIDNGEGSYVLLFTPDKRALTMEDGKLVTTEIFKDSNVEEQALSATEAGNSYLKFDGKKYLFSVAPIGKTGMSVVSLVPEKTILAAASEIRIFTIIFVLLAAAVALIIGTVISNGISKEVGKLNRQMKKVSGGDFTTEFATNRNDEFMLLANGMTDMLHMIRELMQNVVEFIGKVNESSEEVSGTANIMSVSMQDINTAMEEVAEGVASQAQDTESGLQEMSGFSDKLNTVHKGTAEMRENSNHAMQAIEKGKVMVYELSDKSKAAAEITDILIKNIAEVEQNSANIGSIIETIREIADQTNLLSLNASIEAARAGEAGKGFAVVAEEIRKLADQSAEAGTHIREIVTVIQQKTAVTSDSAKRAEEFLNNQAESIEGTVDIFSEINENVTELIRVLGEVSDNMENMIKEKENVLQSIRNIAAVSEETAASAEEVTATVNAQLPEAEKLATEAGKLSEEVSTLQEALAKYKV